MIKIEDRANLRSGGVDDGAPKGHVPGGSGDSVGRNYAAQRDEILGAKYRGVSTSREREDQTSFGFGRTDRSMSFGAFGGGDSEPEPSGGFGDLSVHGGFGDLGDHSGFGPVTDEETEKALAQIHSHGTKPVAGDVKRIVDARRSAVHLLLHSA